MKDQMKPIWLQAQDAGLAPNFTALLWSLAEEGATACMARYGWDQTELRWYAKRITTRLYELQAPEDVITRVAMAIANAF